MHSMDPIENLSPKELDQLSYEVKEEQKRRQRNHAPKHRRKTTRQYWDMTYSPSGEEWPDEAESDQESDKDDTPTWLDEVDTAEEWRRQEDLRMVENKARRDEAERERKRRSNQYEETHNDRPYFHRSNVLMEKKPNPYLVAL